MKSPIRRALLGTAVLMLAAGPAPAGRDSAVAPVRISVTMTDYAFALSRKTVKRGTVVFAVVNKGEVVHDFRIAGRKTPIYEPGRSGVLRLVFTKTGRYAYICTVPGHAVAGMQGVLTVLA